MVRLTQKRKYQNFYIKACTPRDEVLQPDTSGPNGQEVTGTKLLAVRRTQPIMSKFH